MSKRATVMWDAGHGDHDSGAVGAGGTREKDVAIRVALRAREILASTGLADSMLTRERDEFLTLNQRVAMANREGVDAFVSVHCNSAEVPARGVETWIARETRVSYPLAEAVQDAMVDAHPDLPDRGIKRANFVVLQKTQMAACLVELDFIHVPEGEAYLNDEDNQERYARAMVVGVMTYLDLPCPLSLLQSVVSDELPEDDLEPCACGAITYGAQLIEMGAELARIGKLMGRNQLRQIEEDQS